MQETFDTSIGLADSVNWVANHNALKQLFTLSIAALIHYVGTCHGQKIAVENFLERVSDGADLAKNSGAFKLRAFLLSQNHVRRGTHRAGKLYVLALCIKAWNATLHGEQIDGALEWKQDEAFPEL